MILLYRTCYKFTIISQALAPLKHETYIYLSFPVNTVHCHKNLSILQKNYPRNRNEFIILKRLKRPVICVKTNNLSRSLKYLKDLPLLKLRR